MVRLIDADALIREMHNIILEDGEDRRTFYEVIERQPTIEPKKGKWIKHSIGHEHTPWGFDCSECGEWLVVGEEIVKKYNYCPNCGADMRGEQP